MGWGKDVLEWLIPAGLSTAGQAATNKTNRDIAREQMQFQERMSSTAVQRSVEDYRKAGLNPALAYERSASTPGGASATMGSALEKGVSSAQQARALQQQLEINKLQSKADFEVKSAQIQKDQSQSAVNNEEAGLKRQAYNFNTIMQPWQARQSAATAMLQEYLMPKAKYEAGFHENIGRAGPILRTVGSSARNAAEILKMFTWRY